MTDIVIVGAFGQRNPGDDALLAAFRVALPGVGITATAADVRRPLDGVRLVPSGSPARVLTAMRRRDALVVGGGTVFKTLPPHTGRRPHDLLRRALLLTGAARACGRPVAFVGVGVGALGDRRARTLARRLAATADLLVVRDTASAEALLEIGVPAPIRVAADPAWALPPVAVEAARNGVLAVVSHQAGGHDVVRSTAEGLAALGLPARLAPWQVGGGGPDDLDSARALRHELAERGLDAAVLLPPADLAEAVAQAATARVVVTGRFHGIVAAALAGTPSVALAHERKLSALSAALGQPAVRPVARPEALAQAVRDALAHGPASPAAVLRQRSLAEDGFRLLRLLVSGGRSLADEDVPALPYVPAEPEVIR